jgi:hypothetical protein
MLSICIEDSFADIIDNDTSERHIVICHDQIDE